MMTRRLGPLTLFALACLLSACSSIRAAWVADELTARNEEILWNTALVSLNKAGYPVGAGADPGKREIRTGWLQSPGPFKGKGYRQRATVLFQRIEAKRYAIQVRVERERNDSFRPLTHGKWVSDQDNAEHARIVLQYIKSTLGGGELKLREEPSDPFQ